MLAYHVRLLVTDPVHQALWSHPFDRHPGLVMLPVVVGLINIPCQTKVRHFDAHGAVNPVFNDGRND